MTRPLSDLRGPVRALFSDVDGTMTTGDRIEASTYEALERLGEAGIPVSVNVAPVIPFLTDSELESILEAAASAGATSAAYTLVRLPWEVRPIFKEWLEKHFPLKAEHVMSRIRDMRGGRENDPNFGSRRRAGRFGELLSRDSGRTPAVGLDKRATTCSQSLRPPHFRERRSC